MEREHECRRDIFYCVTLPNIYNMIEAVQSSSVFGKRNFRKLRYFFDHHLIFLALQEKKIIVNCILLLLVDNVV